MKKRMIVAMILAYLCAGCTIGLMRGHHGDSVVIVPALPLTVELDADQYYYQNGYFYSYRDNVWFYSASKEGPWSQLPRNHYPREVHYRGQNERGHDNREQDNRDHGDRDNGDQHHDR
jgi:hypothetical protein